MPFCNLRATGANRRLASFVQHLPSCLPGRNLGRTANYLGELSLFGSSAAPPYPCLRSSLAAAPKSP